jgi:hypothetical protein
MPKCDKPNGKRVNGYDLSKAGMDSQIAENRNKWGYKLGRTGTMTCEAGFLPRITNIQL